LTYETSRRNWRIGAVEDKLLSQEGFAACGVVVENEWVYAALFARQPLASDSIAFRVDDIDTIDLFILSEPQLTSDYTISVSVGWYVPQDVFGKPYSTALHIEDEQGNFVEQADFGIEKPEFDCQFQQIHMQAKPVGQYIIKGTIYDWQTGERLDSISPAPDGQRPVIGSVQLGP
jgi:hypothetical protein